MRLKNLHVRRTEVHPVLCLIFCRGRLLHGRHFTYKSINGDTAITFVSTGVEGAFATEEHPYAAHGPWLQVYTDNLTLSFSAVLSYPMYLLTLLSPNTDTVD